MSKPPLPRWTACVAACCLLAVAGCGAIANAPATTSVCYASNGKVDPNIVRETDCFQAGGEWEDRPR
jgi:hypothetical protein